MSRNSSARFAPSPRMKWLFPNILTGKPAFLQKNIPINLQNIFEGTKRADELRDINLDEAHG